ncbi:MAG: glutamate mutase L [Candidatus Cloacimonas sp.]|nr:glutamate mutase L [Candidatus Cloacimonas sp.]
MCIGSNYFLITDIGSTTTKALLIDNRSDKPVILGISHAETTVEAPLNDVRFGVHKAVKNLQDMLIIPLILPSAKTNELSFPENISYLSTSSAGGGLQILVIGLTLFDSAASARRAAFGAGGIILDVFAIDDKRSSADQMLAMRNLHPDMILLCGGTDGGALSGVLRLAEILRIARPLPKYATHEKIPAIYAGNKEAQDMVKRIISTDFDLVVLPNLRPTLQEENLKPTQDMIQKLFMENVMERAPGYAELKSKVHTEILPTPMGVLKSLISATEDDKRSFFAFDIGGATTDVFSYITGHYQRTVSANLGMSYSALNVMGEAGVENLLAYLPKQFKEEQVRNYIGNKTLYPTYNPTHTWELQIEHALAKQAIRLALVQHQQMHYNTQKMGFLEALKSSDIDAYEAKFEYQVVEDSYYFYPSDIDVVIGAGGLFAHAQNHNQCVAILIDSFNAHGITEIWMDKDFITPHMGVLGSIYPKLSKRLLTDSCMEKLALHIRPHFNSKIKKAILKITYTEDGASKHLEVMPESFIYLPGNKKRLLEIQPIGKCILGHSDKPVSLETELPVIIDTRTSTATYNDQVINELKLYNAFEAGDFDELSSFHNNVQALADEFVKVVSLPYKGDIYFEVGDLVQPDDIVACNQFNTPRLFIVNPYQYIEHLTEDLIRNTLLVNPGDKVEFDDNLRQLSEKPKGGYYNQNFASPIRGKLEFVDYSTGSLVFSEIQDYSPKPVHVDLASKLMCPPKMVSRYLKKKEGDYVYHGDLLAQRLESNVGAEPSFVHAPSTGNIVSIDRKSGILTIQYKVDPHNFFAHVQGKVIEVQPETSLAISYKGTRLEGKLGVGNRCHGEFVYVKEQLGLEGANLQGKVLGINFIPDNKLLLKLANEGVKGVVCPGIKQEQLVKYLKSELGVINTGNEILPLCLIISEAFGAESLNVAFQSAFMQFSGKLCHLEPHTRIRAGVARPYICFS